MSRQQGRPLSRIKLWMGCLAGFMFGTVLSTLAFGRLYVKPHAYQASGSALPQQGRRGSGAAVRVGEPTTAAPRVAAQLGHAEGSTGVDDDSRGSSSLSEDGSDEGGVLVNGNYVSGGGGSRASAAPSSPPGGKGHMSFAQLLRKPGGLMMDPELFLPSDPVTDATALQPSTAACIQKGMQQKCHFTTLVVSNNTFSLYDPKGRFPNPIYPADGQTAPLKQNHGYTGHRIRLIKGGVPASKVCDRIVRRPTVFLYRMSGHSPYHLWENNLGPFHRTLQDFPKLKESLNDVSQLLVSFIDRKPVSGPKAPYLLDTLLQSFTDLPLVNASRIAKRTCFENAVVGVAANHFDHKMLLKAMWMHLAGRVPGPLPKIPRVVFISRNHKSVIRGRKIANEPEVIRVINETVLRRTGRPLEYVHMQDYTYQEQVNRTIDTQVIIGPHGAGIANCIWMQKGSVALETASPYGKTLFNLYHSMCKRSDISHMSFVADYDPQDLKLPDSAFNNNKRLYSNLMIPLDVMEKQINRALDKYDQNYAKSQQGRG